MDQPIASSSRQTIIPSLINPEQDSSIRLNLEDASQAQILRAHQRDSAQIWRLTELVSEIVRSIAGTRWLAHKQTIIDLLVKGVYLSLTFGRGLSTFGEEYTDILPIHLRKGKLPSKRRRIITILFILLPSLVFSPMTSNYLRNSSNTQSQIHNRQEETKLQKAKKDLLRFIESPIGKIIPELHMILFLFKGRFFELARRLTGLSYVSTLPPRSIDRKPESYEPLGLMMLLPLLYRLISKLSSSSTTATTSSDDNPNIGIPTPYKDEIIPLSPPLLTPPLNAQQTIIIQSTETEKYDELNTYLDKDCLELPERQCTLCLESRGTGQGSGGTTAVTECGHLFCWGCLGGLEKLECPLCRQALRMERLVAAYNL
ncbi:uncharacterized protein L201_002422 [Kwoniella dendrophila CBS 6074]|uniref:RING-type E3 ubiquitin transferase n=1 Tax=Kwoniella dendrophila CBS 6074 TaxID=1295534 RepID=A0AAX4JQ41_9TREE